MLAYGAQLGSPLWQIFVKSSKNQVIFLDKIWTKISFKPWTLTNWNKLQHLQNSETQISWIWFCLFFWNISRWFCPKSATVYSALDSRHGKKIKHDIGCPPPFQYGPFSTGLPFTTTRSGERLCSIWCVPSTVITASLPLLPTNILLLTNITTWKKKSQHC